ncbi:hypothetical protein CRYUN_Cryun12cG0080300 [Craigia yunnanensis]
MWDLTPDTDLLMELRGEYTFESALADLIDNSSQAVWSNGENDRRLIRGKMDASLNRLSKVQAIGCKPPYLVTDGGIRYPSDDKIEKSLLGSFTKCDEVSKFGWTITPVEFQWPEYTVLLHFFLKEEKFATNGPGSKASQKANARLKCIYFPIRQMQANYSHSSQFSNQPRALAVVESTTLIQVDQNEASFVARAEMQNGGFSQAKSIIESSEKLQDDLRMLGMKIKQHEDSIKLRRTQKNKLDVSIFDMQVMLGKYHSSSAPKIENEDHSHLQSEDETTEQILRHEKSAAGILCQLKIHHCTQASHLTLTKDVLGAVATFGKVDDEFYCSLSFCIMPSNI